MAQVYKGAGTAVAKLPGIQPELDKAASGILARAKARAAAHVDEGNYLASLQVRSVPGRKGVRDRLVESTHPASVAIEYGHWHDTKKGKIFVPGQYILKGAIKGGA